MKIPAILFFWLLFNATSTSAQEAKILALKIGDKMPEIAMGKILNYKTPEINYSDLKGKLVILDFWATWCSPCISSLKDLDSLQRVFGDKIAVIPVTTEDKEIVNNFIGQNKWFQLPGIVADKTLGKLFPHRIIPHDVWIGPDGVIKAITSGKDVTRENIDKVLGGLSLTLKEKRDNMEYNMKMPFLVNGNGGSADNFIYRTIFTNEIPGIGGYWSAIKDLNYGIKSFTNVNTSPVTLYYSALSLARNFRAVDLNYVYIESAGTTHQLTMEEFKKIVAKDPKSYCYSTILPDYMPDSLFFRKYYLDDLNRFLKLKGRIEKKRVPAYEIIRKAKNTDDLLLDKTDSATRFIFSDKARSILVKGQHVMFSQVVDYFRSYAGVLPIVDKTGYTTEKVNIELAIKWGKDDAMKKPLDYEAVRRALNKYGLDIIKVPDGLVEVLILSNTQIEN